MNGFYPEDAKKYLLSQLEPAAAFHLSPADLPRIIDAFLLYDLHFMRVTGVLDEDGNEGDNDYDDDEAFEFIFDAYLSDHPMDDDASMRVANLLNRYMELLYIYLKQHGLADS